MDTPIILKLGGSLIHHQSGKILDRLGKMISELALNFPLLIVPGGGPFADTIRQHDRQLKLSEETCHFMALSAMDEYAFLLRDFIPGSILRDLSDPQSHISRTAAPQILLCSRFLRQIPSDIIPRSWEVTSDSIAAYLAGQMNAAMLVMLKSTDIDPRINEPDIDSFFHQLLPLKMPVWFINGLYPERLARLLQTGSTTGVCLPPNGLSGSIRP